LIRQGLNFYKNGKSMNLNFKTTTTRSVLVLIATGQLFLSGPIPAQTDESNPQKAAEAGKLRGKPNVKAWQKNRDAGQKALTQGQTAEAEAFLQAALGEAEKFDPKDYRLAESLSDLANFRAATGDFAAAEPLCRRALAIRRGDPNRLTEAECLLALGQACRNLLKYEEAEKCLLEARKIVDAKVGRDHPADALCQLYLAQLYQEQRDYSKAEPLFKQALEQFRHPSSKVKFQPMDPATHGVRTTRMTYRPNYNYALDALNGLGQVYLNQDLPEKAEACFKDTVKLVEEQPNAPEANLQLALSTLSAYYLSRTNYAQAEAVLDRLEHTQEKSLGLKNPATLKTLAELALVYDRNSKSPDAEATFKKVLEAREKFQDSDSEEMLVSTGDLAAFYVRHEQYEPAAALYERLWTRAEKLRSADVRELPMLTQLGVIYAKLGRNADLEKVYRQQISISEKLFGPGNKAVLKPLENYAALLRKEKRDAEAEPIEARANAIRGAGKAN
jgi:tetratricopeptide (TPR) repeat protein